MVEPLEKPPGHFDRFNFCVATDNRHADKLVLVLKDEGGANVHNADVPFSVAPMSIRGYEVCQALNVASLSADVDLDDGKTYRLDFTRPEGGAYIAGVVAGLERDCAGEVHPFALILMDNGEAIGVSPNGNLRIV